MKDISKAMTAQWRATHGGEDNDDNEFSLITCFICEQEGHKAYQCPHKKKKIFPGRCNHCHQLGHKAKDCWEKEENKAKRPPNWKSKMHTETSNAAITRTTQDTGSNVEFLLTEIATPDITKFKEFPKELNMILDRNVWIADSGSTTHSTAHKMGMTDIKPVPIQAGITQANGKSEKTECMGNIPIEICNRHGMKLNAAKIVDVNYIPQNKFNLFSLTKMIKQGWILHGNKERIWLTKDAMEISFDNTIQTAAGTLYCTYLKMRHQRKCNCGSRGTNQNEHQQST